MKTNLIWKFALVVLFVVISALSIFPIGQKLKPGIDLAGGSSVLYQIDTTGMAKEEKREIAQNMIRILQQRIDPGNKRNLVWRPQGNDRIEIQMPLATKQTRTLRKAYQDKRDQLQNYNITLPVVRRALIKPTGKTKQQYQADRDAVFSKMVGDSRSRSLLLTQLAEAYDTHMASKELREKALLAKQQIDNQLKEAQISPAGAERLYQQWERLDDPNRTLRIEKLTDGDTIKKELVRKYVKVRQELRDSRSASKSLEAMEKRAWTNLEDANIDLGRLEKFLEASGSKRKEEMARIKASHPQAAPLIDEIIATYDAYAKRSGAFRLDDVEDLKRQLRGSGILEFRILPGSEDLTEAEINDYIERLSKYGPKKAGDNNYIWCKIKNPDDFQASAIQMDFADDMYLLASNRTGEVLLHTGGEDTWRLKNGHVTTDQYGSWAVGFSFNEIGAGYFLDLTKSNLQRPLCILLDAEAISAPNIQSAIRDRGVITGNFSQREVQDLVDKLNAGSLPARLSDQPISVNTIGPTMGRNNLIASLNAAQYGLIAVLVFMVFYYRIPGALACMALTMNLLFIIGVMAFTRATFTMPGIAALILTIGMAVDANVLIFERIREEQMRGSSLRIAIKNGYDRAFRTIFDANLTTFIVALILWILASEEVKGFALTLMIGIISSMFTALFVTRMVFDFLIGQRIIKDKLSMTQLIGKPQIKWMSLRPTFWVISILLVVGGWAVYIGRDEAKNSKYSIEFTGGTSIHVVLTEKGAEEMLSPDQAAQGVTLRENIEQAVRQAGTKISNPLIASARVQQIGPDDRREFEIVTTETNQTQVTLTMGTENTMTAGDIEKVVQNAAYEIGDRRMSNATVTALDKKGNFLLNTNQANVNIITEVIVKAIPGVKFEHPKTKEIVSDAVREALAGKLDLMDDLSPINIKTAAIDDELLSRKPYLGEFAGGLYLSCTFDNSKTDTLERLKDRFDRLRFKTEFENYEHNKFQLFAPDNAQANLTQPIGAVEMAAISSDILHSGGTNDEWQGFVDNELGLFKGALSMKSSFSRQTQIDPSVGKKSMNEALIAIVFSLLAIVAYIWARFGNVRFGMAAVVALVHDVSIAMGMVAASAWLSQTAIGKALLISDFKIDLPMIAGFLTVIGYSLNDTIVVFDRIRENRGKLATLSANIINNSINQTISRTILTSLTTLLVLVVMYIWGGPGLRGFNYVLIIGVLVGTYSSIGIAAPLLYGAKDQDNADKTNDKT